MQEEGGCGLRSLRALLHYYSSYSWLVRVRVPFRPRYCLELCKKWHTPVKIIATSTELYDYTYMIPFVHQF